MAWLADLELTWMGSFGGCTLISENLTALKATKIKIWDVVKEYLHDLVLYCYFEGSDVKFRPFRPFLPF